MGCQSRIVLGDNITFSICTHDPDTGALTDADAAPIYRVYEDETSTPILTGTMAKLDDANTTGFYSEQIAGTTANGFEAGKSYTIYISAAVGGVTGGISYAFDVESTPAHGQWTITVTVRNASTLVALPDVLVTVKDSGDTVTRDQRRTDASGQCASANAFSLDNATYKIHLALPGYQASTQTLVVNGANQSVTYDLTAIAIGAPTSPDACRVYGYEYLNGNPQSGATVTWQLLNAPQVVGSSPGAVMENTKQTTTTDANGYWYADLIQGKTYQICIESGGVTKTIVVPASATKDFSEFL